MKSTMNNQDRDTLRTTRTYLIENIENVNSIMDKLLEKNVFNTEMKEEVEIKGGKRAKVREMLDILPKRGPNAFDTFLQILYETDNGFISEELQKRRTEQSEDNRPQKLREKNKDRDKEKNKGLSKTSSIECNMNALEDEEKNKGLSKSCSIECNMNVLVDEKKNKGLFKTSSIECNMNAMEDEEKNKGLSKTCSIECNMNALEDEFESLLIKDRMRQQGIRKQFSFH